MASKSASSPVTPVTPAQQNAAATALILNNSINCLNPVQSLAVATPESGGNIVNVAPASVGLLKKLVVIVSGTITNTDSSNAITRTSWGPANLLRRVSFTDLSNYQRVNTSGRHLAVLASARRRRVFGSPATYDTHSVGYGNNYQSIFYGPDTIAHGATATIYAVYEIPVAYSDSDLSGAIYMGVTNATANLQLTINQQSVIASGDPLNAIYSGATGTLTNVQLQVYGGYLDQLPSNNGSPILPSVSMAKMYLLQDTNFSGLVANQDCPIPYQSFRTYLSTLLTYDNGGSFNAGTDITRFKLQAASTFNYFDLVPRMALLRARDTFGTDLPAAVYYFDHRDQPIATSTYGNLSLIVNASTVNSGAFAELGYEMIATSSVISSGTTLGVG